MVKDITIVSLSRGIIGENMVKHEVDLGIQRLKEYGLNVHFSEHALSGLDYIEKHPEMRAKDLLDAFQSDTDMILCAIGGEDTYRLLPYLFDHDELKKAVTDKIFLGFSDTTFNHLMLNKVGLRTYYGQAFLSDICEIAKEMLPYTKKYFEELIQTGRIAKIVPSDVWYEGREDFSVSAMGTDCPSHKNQGFELLQGAPRFSGKIFGGCIDSLFDVFDNTRFEDTVSQCAKYQIFPTKEEWEGKILLIESSEEYMSREKYAKALEFFKEEGVFDAVNGVLVGKPMNEVYFKEYKEELVRVIDNPNLPIVTNINIGHATPRCIIPFGREAVVDVDDQSIIFLE